jgi:HEPN domain-containing protein
MKPSVQQWVALARQDFAAAERLLSDPPMPSLVAVHLQQCVEKGLKAVIESAGGRIPKSHDLVWLWQVCKENVDGDLDLDAHCLEALSTVYLDARYPTGLGVMPSGPPSIDDVRELQKFAAHVLDVVLPRLLS